MQFHARPAAVGSHRGIVLGEPYGDSRNLWESVANRADDSARHVFEKARRDGHLCLNYFIQVGITDGVRKVIGFHSTREVIFHTQRYGEVRTHRSFLGHNPMKGMEADLVDKQGSLHLSAAAGPAVLTD